VNANLRKMIAVSVAALTCSAWGQETAEQEPFPKELLGNPEYIEIGKEVFGKICQYCHGKTVYPGKAPKLNPVRYTPEFVFGRVTNGFRAMPSFKETFSEKERQGVTVYVLSQEFSNHP